MRLRWHLAIMARAPRLGAGKKRLARDLGAVAAWRFQRDTTAALLRRLSRDRRWRTWLAVTPDSAPRSAGGLWPFRGTLVAQGDGDLGQRMGRLLALPPPGPVVIVGSDIPAIQPHHIAAAFRRLGRHDWVFGPAEDGGYWLVGARRRPVLRPPFAGVRWSSPTALADTLRNLEADGAADYALLETLRDIDTAADLAPRREDP